mgnify:CR=1 FL=1
MKVKVNEASGPVLDWMVAKCEEANIGEGYYTGIVLRDGEVKYAPSIDWAQAGPIIEREMLAPEPLLDTNCALIKWRCRNWKGDGSDFCGPTPLIAAMRCFVASKLGDEVDVPEELR